MKKIFLLFIACLLFPRAGFGGLRSNYGLVQPTDWEERATYLTLNKMGEPLPSHFDWREKLGKQVSVLDQKSCGSCWAHSRVSTLAWQLLIQTGQMLDFSPQELVSCDREQYGCGGGFWDDYELGGISLENEFPYKASNLSCKSGLPRKQRIDKWLYIGGKFRSPTVDEMKQVIYEIGPIGVTVSASGNFPNGCGNGGPNHMVVVTGWDDPTKSWIMQNSWGTQWGNKGYAPVKYGCYRIGETAAVPVLNVTPPVPVTFTLENDSVVLTVTVEPQSGYGVDLAKKTLKNAINAVGVQ